MKKTVNTLLLGSVLALSSTAVLAEKITIVVPYPPGGAADQLARVIAQGLTEQKGHQVLVENRPGAGAQIAMNQLQRVRKDDDIVLILSDHSAFTLNQKLYKNLNYDIKNDIKPVTLVAEAPIFLFSKTEGPLNTAESFLAAANSQNLRYGVPGIGTGTHLTAEMLNLEVDGNLTVVPYRGAAPALVDLVGGQLDFMFDVSAGSTAFVENNQLTVLAVADQVRSDLKPDVPTLKELGVNDVDFRIWWGLGAQSKLKDELINQVQADVSEVLNNQKVIDDFRKSGILVQTTTPLEMESLINGEISTVGPLIDELGLSIQ
ncbi:Bug family tripartite tricarboxylate transporter substrate binding protein [Paenalcaligenes hominis]|uniref:Bug family tripartite tricarboxylate transporter substrate binding protein n=1 Tax=Paenalcaligenes hominis TaxID=643674 RepID=UPI003523E194